MKKIGLSFSMYAVAALLLFSCNKKDNVVPEADKEVQSSIDISYAAMVITDLEMICGHTGENNLYPKFYQPAPGATGTMTASRDTFYKYINIGWNKTKCMDGRVRDGSIFMNYTFSNPNAKYYHDFEFVGKVSLSNYKVDNWLVQLKNSFIISNKVAPVNYDPKVTNLSWNMTGDFVLHHPTDSSKNIHCYVDLTKTLLSAGNPTIFPYSKQAAINWTLATVQYKGTLWGETSRNVPFKYEINETTPLVRNFTCFPDKVNGISVVSNTVTPQFEEFHPFINGVASFTTGDLYPRKIYYGMESGGDPQCDNTGVVAIKGISYPIDFKKEYK